MIREEAVSAIKSAWNQIEYEWGPNERLGRYEEVLIALGCTPEEISAPEIP